MDIRERFAILDKAEKDPNFAVLVREKVKRSCVDFANYFGWVYEPRSKHQYDNKHSLPVELFPHQIETLEWLSERYKNQEDGLIEKSRDMGATWTALVIWNVWMWLFADNFDSLIGSKKENDVDNRTPASVFGKIDYYINYLPFFIKPMGFEPSKHRSHMRLVNPQNGNAIVGEATNPQFSRSGRYGIIFLDEFAFVEKSNSIWQACGDSTNVRIPISTPKGKGNKFAELALNSNIKKLTLHWSKHPHKDKEWYEHEKLRRTPDEIAQELDISYEGSQKGRVFGDEWDQLVADNRLTDVLFNPDLPVYTSWDFGIADATAVGFYQVDRAGSIHLFDYYEKNNSAIDHYIRILDERAKKQGYRYAEHFGDIAGNHRDITSGLSAFDMLRRAGYYIKGLKIKDDRDAINATKIMLRRMFVDKKLTGFTDAIENYHYKYNEERVMFDDKPYHDWSSHACKQLQYFAVNFRMKVMDDERPHRRRFPLTQTQKISVTTY